MVAVRADLRPRRVGVVHRCRLLLRAVLAVLSPWPALTAVCWAVIGLFGLWLGLLGIAMATGLAMVLKSNAEIPEEYWRSIIDY